MKIATRPIGMPGTASPPVNVCKQRLVLVRTFSVKRVPGHSEESLVPLLSFLEKYLFFLPCCDLNSIRSILLFSLVFVLWFIFKHQPLRVSEAHGGS